MARCLNQVFSFNSVSRVLTRLQISRYSCFALSNSTPRDRDFQQLSSRSSSSSSILTQLSERYGDKLDFDRIKERGLIETPEYFNFASDVIDEWAKRDEQNKKNYYSFWFVTCDEKEIKWTFSDLSRLSKKAANALQETGGGTDWTRCILILPKTPEWWLINLAITRLGAEVVHATTLLTLKDIEYRVQKSKAQSIITSDAFVDKIEEIAPKYPFLKTKILVSKENDKRSGWSNFNQLFDKASENHECRRTRADAKSTLFFTSGTTNLPKIVVHNYGNLGLTHYILAKFALGLGRGKVMWNIADPGWAKAAWSSFYAPWIAGATVFIHEMPQFDPALVVKTLQTREIHSFCGPPTVYRMLIAQPLTKIPSLTHCLSAGEPLNPEVIKKFENSVGVRIREGYGQTETPPMIATFPNRPFKEGSIGEPSPLYNVQIVDDDGKPLPRGTQGHIALKVKPERPLGLFREYEGDPEKTAATVVGDFYITGDTGHMDEDGFIFFNSRADDIITSSAYRIGPFEVESALQEHPDVLESAAVGSPDPVRGEVVKAFIILKPSAKNKDKEKLVVELQNHVKKVTAPYKYPRKIEFVDSLPKTISGKTKRAELRKQEYENAKK